MIIFLYLALIQSNSYYVTANWNDITGDKKYIYGATGRGIAVISPKTGETIKDITTPGITISIASTKSMVGCFDSIYGIYLFKKEKKEILEPLLHYDKIKGTYNIEIKGHYIILNSKKDVVAYKLNNENLQKIANLQKHITKFAAGNNFIAIASNDRLTVYSLTDNGFQENWNKKFSTQITAITFNNKGLLVSDLKKNLLLFTTDNGNLLDSTTTVEVIKGMNFTGKYTILYKHSSISIIAIKNNKITPLSTARISGTTMHSTQIGNKIYFAATDKIKLIDVKKIKNPEILDNLREEFTVGGVNVNHGIVYGALGTKGLTIFKPLGDSLKLYSLIEGNGFNYNNLYLVGGLLFGLAGRGGVNVYDVGRLKKPVLKNHKKPGGYVSAMTRIRDKYLTACGKQGVKLLWFCPCGPFDIKSMIPLEGEAVDVEGFNQRGYVAGGEKGLYIVDCTHESNIETITNYDTVGFLSSLKYRNGIVFAGDKYLGFYIFDVRGDIIKKISFTEINTGVRDIDVKGDTLFLATGENGILLYDISNLKKPEEIGKIETPGIANYVFYQDNKLYVGDTYSIEIFKL